MRVTMTSVAARAGRVNEDFTGAVPTAAVLIDGAGIPGTEAICRHGVAWYAGRLGGRLLSLLSTVSERSLPALLAEAITQVTDDHRDTCDVTDPISPSATVVLLRRGDGFIEHLVLGDSVLILDRVVGAPLVVSDPREVIDPRAADEAITGRCPIPELTGAVLLSNGASRIVDRFGLTDWPGF